MRIITIAGVSPSQALENKAFYSYDENLAKDYSLKKHNYTNMLALLADNFSTNLVPIFTNEAKESQLAVLQDEFGDDRKELFNDEFLIRDVEDYYDILALINKVLSTDEEYIIDLTHGFRHIPILATIAIITHALSDAPNIKDFRKSIMEIERFRNNLAHGNSDSEIKNARITLSKLIRDYEKFCITDDVLRKGHK